jgi:ferredoxin--NADP+ reductase
MIKLIEVYNPQVASKAKPGQFVILRLHERGKRFPITISGASPEDGTIRLVFNEVGTATKQLGSMNVGDRIMNMPGPLGNPTKIRNYGTVLCFGGGVMIGPMFWIASALKKAGNYIINVIGARTKELLFFEDKFREISNEFYVATDDGSYGYKGLDFLRKILDNRDIDFVYGTSVATATLREICRITEPFGIKTVVALTPIMVDGSGMCGACRVTVGGERKFACVDGPEFDGHEVDWDSLEKRKRMYTLEERILSVFSEVSGFSS